MGNLVPLTPNPLECRFYHATSSFFSFVSRQPQFFKTAHLLSKRHRSPHVIIHSLKKRKLNIRKPERFSVSLFRVFRYILFLSYPFPFLLKWLLSPSSLSLPLFTLTFHLLPISIYLPNSYSLLRLVVGVGGGMCLGLSSGLLTPVLPFLSPNGGRDLVGLCPLLIAMKMGMMWMSLAVMGMMMMLGRIM